MVTPDDFLSRFPSKSREINFDTKTIQVQIYEHPAPEDAISFEVMLSEKGKFGQCGSMIFKDGKWIYNHGNCPELTNDGTIEDLISNLHNTFYEGLEKDNLVIKGEVRRVLPRK